MRLESKVNALRVHTDWLLDYGNMLLQMLHVRALGARHHEQDA